ncbi:hypothetical protein X975_06898, partial [Stegodyphus mimosarum]
MKAEPSFCISIECISVAFSNCNTTIAFFSPGVAQFHLL